MRIVSLAPSNTEILYAIGAEDQIVATTSLCNYPENARDIPSVGGWTDPKVERMSGFDPDILMASDDLQDNAVEKLEEEGYEVFQVKPHDLDEVFDSIRKIGDRVGKLEEAEKLIGRMKRRLEEIKIPNSPRIYCEEWMDPPMVSGNWIPGLIEKIGGNYFIEGGRSRKFELAELKQFDPEYIFLNVCGAGNNLGPEEVLKRDEWKQVTAVKNKDVYVINDSLLNRPGPRILEGVEKVSGIVNQ